MTQKDNKVKMENKELTKEQEDFLLESYREEEAFRDIKDRGKQIMEYLESKGIDFSHYNPHQRAEIIYAFELGTLIGEVAHK